VSHPDGTPLRVLVLSAGPWNPAARQLALAARALMEDGLAVRAITPCAREWQGIAPALAVESLVPEHGTREHRTAITAAVEAARPTVVITDDELLRRVAVRALSPGACVLQRLPLGAALPEDSVATRFVSRNVAPAWLVPSTEDSVLARSSVTPEKRRIPAVPMPFAVPPSAARPESRAPRQLVLIPDPEAPQAATAALRTAAMVMRRHATLRLTLHGTASALQPLRVHAAALRIAAQVDVRAMPTFDASAPTDVLATWVAADGDLGVTAALWAMRAGHPVVAPASSAVASLLEDRESGVVVPGGTSYDEALVASELARLFAHREDRTRMREGAVQRAQQFDLTRLARALRSAIDRAAAAARR
jgi:hypothetical protein